jgi:hypothetical protein
MRWLRRWWPLFLGGLLMGGCADTEPLGAVLVERHDDSADPAPVDGAGFTLTAGTMAYAMAEIAPGRFCREGLPIVAYALTETTVPNGFPAVPARTVTPEVGTRCTAPLPEPVVVGTAALPADVYVWVQDGFRMPMIGVTLQLTDGAGFAASCATDEHASCGFLDVPLGSYTLHEVVPVGYVPGRLWLDGVVQAGASVPFDFVVGPGSAPATGQIWDIGLENLSDALGGVMVEKVDDAPDPVPVAGAGFTLRGGGYVVEMTEVETGRFCADGLPILEFTLAETSVPNGYVGAAPTLLTPQVGRYCGGVVPDAIQVVNAPVPGDVWVWTIDDDDGPVTGAIFRLTGGDGYDATCRTDEHAMCGFLDLPLGTYTFSIHSLPANMTFDQAWLDTVPIPGLPHAWPIEPGPAPSTGPLYTFKVALVRD